MARARWGTRGPESRGCLGGLNVFRRGETFIAPVFTSTLFKTRTEYSSTLYRVSIVLKYLSTRKSFTRYHGQNARSKTEASGVSKTPECWPLPRGGTHPPPTTSHPRAPAAPPPGHWVPRRRAPPPATLRWSSTAKARSAASTGSSPQTKNCALSCRSALKSVRMPGIVLSFCSQKRTHTRHRTRRTPAILSFDK